MRPIIGWLTALLLLLSASASAAEVQVAVAANFTAPMQKIAADFERDTGHKAALSFGSTGKFYAQIVNGAPFEILLAADDETPARLEKEGLGVAGARLTYAIGKLVLWSASEGVVDQQAAVLKNNAFRRLALANPKTSPYGAAALEVLGQFVAPQAVQGKTVQGESITQAWQFVSTGNAELGFVALSQVFKDGKLASGSAWIVPQSLYTPLRQDAILLAKGKDNPAAAALLAYLKSEKARSAIRAFGYDLP